MMSRAAGVAALALALLALIHHSQARPSHVLSRPKRVSDQRLAELETLIALAKMRGKLVTVPVGFGQVDPGKLGRRRRSNTESSWQKLRRILRSVAEEEANKLSPSERQRYARLFASPRWDEADPEEETSGEDERGLMY